MQHFKYHSVYDADTDPDQYEVWFEIRTAEGLSEFQAYEKNAEEIWCGLRDLSMYKDTDYVQFSLENGREFLAPKEDAVSIYEGLRNHFGVGDHDLDPTKIQTLMDARQEKLHVEKNTRKYLNLK